MTRKIFIFFFCIIIFQKLAAQQFTAKYNVTREVIGQIDGKSETIADLDLEGYFYLKGNRIITFLKPLYLMDYPTGQIQKKISSYNMASYDLLMGPIQSISYYTLDSMIYRSRNELAGLNGFGQNNADIMRPAPGYNKWELSGETKIILGLSCEKATLAGSTGTPAVEMWFSKDIPMPLGLYGLADVPGLMVEGEMFSSHEKFKLESYSFDTEIPDAIFWPKVFNEPFTESAAVKAKMKN